MLVCWGLQAQEDRPITLRTPVFRDTIKGALLPPNILNDSVKKDTATQEKAPSNTILDQIRYSAKDYVRLSQKDKKIYLYNEAEIYYQDTELKAGIIVMDYTTNEVYAGRIKDEDGNYSQLPFFKQGQNEVIPDSIRFNFDTKRAIIWNSRTEQQAQVGAIGGGNDAMKVLAERTKKENDSVYFLRNGRLTTSKDTIDPDYFIRIRKAKFVPGKKIIAGFSNMYLVQVPTPIALPFAYFPLTNNRTGGLIFPTFTSDPQRGYAIQNGGYYFPISDYLDFTIVGDFFTNGSYGFRTRSVYKKRYKYQGSIDFRFENLITSQRGFEDYSRQTIYNLQIQHSQDSKANPNSRFSASVNLGSSSYFRNSANQVNLALTQNNNLSSSISYSKTFPAYPRVDLSLTATHNQNTNTEVINMTLPTLQMNMERIFPFAKRDGVKKGALQNINFQYSARAENRIQTVDSLFLTGRMFEDSRVGARHTIPINTNFKLAQYLSVTVGGTYEDVWTFETFTRGQNPDNTTSNQEVVLDTVRGFDRWNRYGLQASIGTTVYGDYRFKEGKRLQAIRHVMRPSLGWNYTPSFEQFYDTYTNLDGELEQYSRFEGTLNGAPSLNRSNSVSFSLSNTIEAKIMPKDSSETEPKKISLLSNLNLATSYNFEADSLKLAPLSFNGGTTLLNNKLSINFQGSLDPYAIDNNGTRINTLNIKNGGSLFRLTRASVNLGYSLNNETFKKKKKGEKEEEDPDADLNDYRAASGGRKDDLFGFGLNDRDANFAFDNEGEDGEVDNPIYGTTIPWDLRLAFTSTYSNTNRQNEFTNNSLMFSGNVQLSPRWKVRVSSGYDFKNKGFNLTQLGFTRNLKSFDLRFNWVPFGRNERWDFFIGISSSILRDLKWDQRSQRNIGRR
ncbi:putative LPS assembly protein LptD [Aureicoccus marinus]|uniref:putative LPS assembly protein LptD n=1 Tax=Aureicoccus marinus TaxID=754435 RepID=UPI001C614DEB|nr:putative LPS assembly protein LptD [Aureicoccus marinus]